MPDIKNILMRRVAFTRILKFIKNRKLDEKYPAFIPVIAELDKKLVKIYKLPYGLKPGRNSETKKYTGESLAQAAFCVSSGVFAFAQISGNVALKNAVHYTFSDFYRPDETTLLGRCRQVLNASKKVKNPEHYGLMPFVIEKLCEEIKRFMEFKDEPVSRVKQHARAMRQADNLLNQCLAIIKNQLDPLILVVNCSEKFLLSDYNIKRKINKCPGRKRKYIRKQKIQPEASNEKFPVQTKITPPLSSIIIREHA